MTIENRMSSLIFQSLSMFCVPGMVIGSEDYLNSDCLQWKKSQEAFHMLLG